MADFQYRRGRGGNYRGGRINKRSNRGRSYGTPPGGYKQHSGSMISSSRVRLDEDVQMNGAGEELHRNQSYPQHRRSDPPAGGQYRIDYRSDRRRGRRPFNNDAGHALQRLGLPTAVSHLQTQVQASRVNENDWFKITIPKGRNISKDFILTSIRSSWNANFEPINFHEAGTTAVFFVKGKSVALAITGLSDRFTLPDNSKLSFGMQRLSSRPATVMSEEVFEKLKLMTFLGDIGLPHVNNCFALCMNKRYNVVNCALDLSNLSNDVDLRRDELYLDLNHNSVADRVIRIIGEYIPELKSLNLNENQLSGLKQFSTLSQKAPALSIFSLANNRLRSERELQFVEKLQLEELILQENPLRKNFEDLQSYVRAIRKLFPKVLKLDGTILPPPITFDIDTPTTLPAVQGSFFLDEQCKNHICRFINCYFMVYDSDNRQQLMDAYHPEVMFSISNFNTRALNRIANWVDYQTYDRNLKSIRDAQKRQNLLKKGQIDVLSVLTKLPASQHSAESFLVDVNLATPIMLTFTIQGVFKERASKSNVKPVRKFARTFVTIPSSNDFGLTIINETFSITVASAAIVEKYFSASSSTSTPVAVVEPTSNSGLSEVQVQMVQQFSVQSGMNLTWSTRCLAENEWNYDRAAAVFLEVNAKQGIPPEAFFQS